ncbi:hypothetical protein IP81_03905 [Novosphingobium sp. AAP83]|nr:hypothetical protein IP81_03905 [Novosphingobium sp. AAP83]
MGLAPLFPAWAHPIHLPGHFFELGARQDFGAGPDRTYGVIGVEGLAPYWFELGTRLRYEVVPEFAPYAGLHW